MKENRLCRRIGDDLKKADNLFAARRIKGGQGNMHNPKSQILSCFAVWHIASQTDQGLHMFTGECPQSASCGSGTSVNIGINAGEKIDTVNLDTFND